MNFIPSEIINEGNGLLESEHVINVVKNQEIESEHFTDNIIQDSNNDQVDVTPPQESRTNSFFAFLNKYRFWIIVVIILLLLLVAGYYIYKNKTTVLSVDVASPTFSPAPEPLMNVLLPRTRAPNTSPTAPDTLSANT